MAAGWGAAVLVLLAALARAGEIRHLILVIGDGLSWPAEVAASRYLFGEDASLSWHAFPYRAPVATWDATAYDALAAARGAAPFAEERFDPLLGYDPALGGAEPTLEDGSALRTYFLTPRQRGRPAATDSASAATAMSTGLKTDDGNLAWRRGDPPDGRLITIAELARASGRRIGIVTTVPFNHATPAGFVAHNRYRGDYRGQAGSLDREILAEVQPEVVIGGGHPDWDPDYLSPELLAQLRADGLRGRYEFVERRAGQAAAPALQAAAERARSLGRSLCGIFGGEGGFFGFRRVAQAPGAPRTEPATPENPTLAEAARAALTVLAAEPRGFFLLVEQGDIDWACHANDYPALIGAIADLEEAVRAIVAWIERPGDAVAWDNTLLVVTSDHANGYLRLHRRLGRGELPAVDGRGRPSDGSASFATTHHTNELVWLAARGAGWEALQRAEGSWYPGTRIIDNTQLFHAWCAALGLEAPPAQRLAPRR
ncbi:MAG: alkaline phosphatase [Planctomycetota bacterium]|nr:alkaline phosphatase [Planctomycetota bacterium]MDW8373680.1 alkaline phosphatase [Planctomycetota bacterium]